MRLFIALSTLLLASTSFAAVTEIEKTCASLAKLSVLSQEKAVVTKAEMTAGGAVGMPNFGTFNTVKHCLVEGKIKERKGTDGKQYYIGFQMRLPVDWNGKFLFQGGGGMDGVTRPAVGVSRGNSTDKPALDRGYAVISTDGGHQNEAGALGGFMFGLEPEARDTHAYSHIPAVTKVGKALVEGAYSKPPERSYIMGCSNGGRQALKAIQNMPYDYDGAIAQAPAFRVPEAALDMMRWVQTMSKFAPKGADGRPDLGNALTQAELDLITTKVLEKCDALDGLKDGMIYNTRACTFDIRTIACKKGQNSACLPEDKANALHEFQSGKSKDGKVHYSTWNYDTGFNAPSFRFWRLGAPASNPNNSAAATLIPGSVAYNFTTPPTKAENLYDFALTANTEEQRQKMSASTKEFPNAASKIVPAVNTNYDTFSNRGAKLIITHGMSDPIFSPNDTIAYYNRMKSRYGEGRIPHFARLFLQPGMGHCSGGAAADEFDLLTALENWVEKEEAPEKILSTTRANPSNSLPAGRSRPMCHYPFFAKYDAKKKGDIESADSFSCAMKL